MLLVGITAMSSEKRTRLSLRVAPMILIRLPCRLRARSMKCQYLGVTVLLNQTQAGKLMKPGSDVRRVAGQQAKQRQRA